MGIISFSQSDFFQGCGQVFDIPKLLRVVEWACIAAWLRRTCFSETLGAKWIRLRYFIYAAFLPLQESKLAPFKYQNAYSKMEQLRYYGGHELICLRLIQSPLIFQRANC